MNLWETLALHKRQAERLFCGCALVNPENARHDCGWLTPENFEADPYRAFWRAIQAGVDPFQAAMEQGIYNELIDASTEVVSSFAANGLAQTIADDAYFLMAAKLITQIASVIHARDKIKALQLIEELAKERPVAGDEIPTALDIAMNLDSILQDDSRAVKTMITPLDSGLGGLENQTLTILAARPSMGKTSLAFQIARSAASQKIKTIYFSLEMSAAALWARASCGSFQMDWRDVLNRQFNQAEMDYIRSSSVNLAAQYGDYLLIDDSTRLTIEAIWSKVAKYNPGLFIVDHQGIISHPESNPVKRAGLVTWGIKQIAKEFNCPALVLQQLNRGVEMRERKRPVMSDLRESGELEEIADNVLFLFRDDYYREADKQALVSRTEIIIAKHRMGSRNSAVFVDFHKKRQWFYRIGDPELEKPLPTRKDLE